MPNLLQDAANWTDGSGASPPTCWDGTGYVFTELDTLTLTATAAAGDTLAATLTGTQQGQRHQIAINVNGADVIPWGSIWDSFPESIDITLNAGDTVEIALLSDACGYAPDFTLTPPAAPPPPPPPVGPVVRQQTTHRIVRGYDGLVTCYVRGEQGPLDLTDRALTVGFRGYGRNCVLASVGATQASAGKVTFTVPASVIDKQLPGSLYRLDVEADGSVVYEALLEVM